VSIQRTQTFAPPIGKGVAVFLPRPASLLARVALVAVNLAAVTFFLLSYTPHGVSFGPYRIDLDVYRNGGHVWLSGGDLYGRLPATRSGARLPFTYPPIAAVLLLPLSLVPMTVAGTVLTLVTIALVAVVLRVFLSCLAGLPGGSRWALAWLLPPALFLEPVRSTLAFGQVNVALMALVSLDCLLEAPRWPRGVLVGLAAAVKLTPAAFVLFFLLRRDYRAGGAAALSFSAVTGAGLLLAWHDSVRYWTSIVFQTGRIGGAAYAGNQSIQAVLARAGLDPRTPAGTAVWLVLSIVVLVAACRGMRSALAASENSWALSLNAFAALLISPISWSHHWVWSVPAILTLAILSRRQHLRLPLAMAVSGLLIFGASPQWWFPPGEGRELRWAVWQQATGSSYVLFAALVLLLSAGAKLIPTGKPMARTALLLHRWLSLGRPENHYVHQAVATRRLARGMAMAVDAAASAAQSSDAAAFTDAIADSAASTPGSTAGQSVASASALSCSFAVRCGYWPTAYCGPLQSPGRNSRLGAVNVSIRRIALMWPAGICREIDDPSCALHRASRGT
jgi:alpha-1,2-mannosyltransferase